jgi:hypothetical protein
MVLLALVSVPFVASVAQESAHHESQDGVRVRHSSKRAGQLHAKTHDNERDSRCEHLQQGKHEGTELKCGPTPPPLPPPSTGASVVSGPGGTVTIGGQVYWDNGTTFPGQPGWTVQLTGAATATGVTFGLTAVTDGSGNYSFINLPAGSYTMCEVVQIGWTESYPTMMGSCPVSAGNPTGFGYPSFMLLDGQGAPYTYFGNK